MVHVGDVHIEIWAILVQLLYLLGLVFFVVVLVILAVNAVKQSRSLDKMENLLREISDKLGKKE